MKFEFLPIKTRIINPPKDEIWDVINGLEIRDGDIIFITSKILAIHQGRCVPALETSKEELINQEADYFLPYIHCDGFKVNLTITNNVLIPNAGIDESNSNGHFILWPKDISKLCNKIRSYLIKKNGISKLGIIATDSHTTSLRWGVTGITIGLAGVEPLKDIRGEKDIFGRAMHVTQVNKIDPLTSMAVLLMGENSEQTPIVILRNYKNIVFSNDAGMENFYIPPEKDLYSPLLKVMKKNEKKI